jgi:hypothetical protein
MSRFLVQGVSGQGAQQVVTPLDGGRAQSVTIENTGTTNVWVADNQTNLISSIVAGTPNYGLVLVPGQVVQNPKMVGGRWALTAGPAGSIEVEASGC